MSQRRIRLNGYKLNSSNNMNSNIKTMINYRKGDLPSPDFLQLSIGRVKAK
jgi:hypothetical protein